MALFATETWTMRHRLLLTIGAILVVCQLISVFWLWHESKEQIQLLVASAIEGHNNQKHVEHEVREAVASLLVPSLLIVGLALYISMLAVRKITRPLSRLQSELENRTPDNLTPIVLSESVPEVTAVTTALNQLVSRLNLTLDRERLFTADVAHELRTPLAGLRLHLELLAKVHGMGVDPLIQRLDQMTTSISQLLQLARVGQSFSAGSYQQVLLLDDVVKPLQDELEAMLAQRQQRLLLTDIENALRPFSWTLKLESPMSRRKYTFEQRLEVVMHYLATDEGYRLTSARFNVPRTQVRLWVAAYDVYGEEGLKPRDKGVSIDPEIRVEAVKAVLTGQISQTQAAAKFNVAGAASVGKWMKVFSEHGEQGLRSLRVGKKRALHMIDDPVALEVALERSKDKHIQELERKVRSLELRVLYLKKLKALVR